MTNQPLSSLQTVSSENVDDEFTRLFVAAQDKLRGFAFSLTLDQSDADDLMQEAMLAIWERFDDFDPERPFLPWASSFVYRKVLEHRRRFARDSKVLSSEALRILMEEQLAKSAGDRPIREVLDQCLKKLPAFDRELLFWRYSPGTTLQELASKHGRTVNAMSKRLQKVRANVALCVRRNVRRVAT